MAGQAEFQALSSQDLAACTEAAKPGSARVADLDQGLVASLYRRGLLYFNVPIWPDDHVSIPPLEVRVESSSAELCLKGPDLAGASRSTMHKVHALRQPVRSPAARPEQKQALCTSCHAPEPCLPLAFSPESASRAGAPGAADNCGPAMSEPKILVRA